MKKESTLLKNKNMLCIEAVCYVITIMLVILLNNYGIIFIRMIPLLFLLGLAGNIVFDRPVITSVFGSLVSFCIIYMQRTVCLKDNFIESILVLALIGMGEIFGELIKKIYDDRTKTKVMTKFKRILIYFLTIFFIVFPIFLNSYINGNVFGYFKSKDILNEYINKGYEKNDEFSIVNTEYEFSKYKGYIFNLKNNYDNTQNDLYTFIVYSDKSIKDGYKEKLIEKNNNILNDELEKFIIQNNISTKHEGYNISLQCEYPDIVDLKISYKVDIINDENIDDFSKSVVDILKTFKCFNDYDKITQSTLLITTNDKSDTLETVIDKSKFNSNYEYLVHSLKEVYFK